ncbi:MAG: hypothetical protein QOH60_4600 [Mycobacterium sp.]|jgi:hypothetical protein|nr:hypothetical protein [Mycobacterium sp.]
MRIRLKHMMPTLAAAGVVLAIAAAPVAAADGAEETCTNLNNSAVKCQSPGNAEINDSLPYANVLPQYAYTGGQTSAPYGGPGGGPG